MTMSFRKNGSQFVSEKKMPPEEKSATFSALPELLDCHLEERRRSRRIWPA
jgi:hypothetical protein